MSPSANNYGQPGDDEANWGEVTINVPHVVEYIEIVNPLVAVGPFSPWTTDLLAGLAFVKSDLRFDLEKLSLDPYTSPRTSSESYNPDPLSPTPSSQESYRSSTGSGAAVAVTGFLVDEEAQAKPALMYDIAAHTSTLSTPDVSTAGVIEYSHSGSQPHHEAPTSALSQTTSYLDQEIEQGQGEQTLHNPTFPVTKSSSLAGRALKASVVVADAQADTVPISTLNLSGARAVERVGGVQHGWVHSAITDHPDVPTSALSQTLFHLDQEIEEGKGEQEWHASMSTRIQPGSLAAGTFDCSTIIADAQVGSLGPDHVQATLSTTELPTAGAIEGSHRSMLVEESVGVSSPTSESNFSLDVEIVEQSKEGETYSGMMADEPSTLPYLFHQEHVDDFARLVELIKEIHRARPGTQPETQEDEWQLAETFSSTCDSRLGPIAVPMRESMQGMRQIPKWETDITCHRHFVHLRQKRGLWLSAMLAHFHFQQDLEAIPIMVSSPSEVQTINSVGPAVRILPSSSSRILKRRGMVSFSTLND
ncbi:hypothetical protein DXG01_012586 [Tephrocybe rancida]|nr:hypothetical protein DXG01_012586 [Tephrocybe rancida]